LAKCSKSRRPFEQSLSFMLETWSFLQGKTSPLD
jgi:hypothetical protein